MVIFKLNLVCWLFFLQIKWPIALLEDENCQSKFPVVQGDILKLLILFFSPKDFQVAMNYNRESNKYWIIQILLTCLLILYLAVFKIIYSQGMGAFSHIVDQIKTSCKDLCAYLKSDIQLHCQLISLTNEISYHECHSLL